MTQNLTEIQWFLIIFSGILIGMSKTGISGAGLLVVPVFASIFGAKVSVGLVLPMLIVADIFAVKFYNRHAEWKFVLKLLPWTFVGILIAFFVGQKINDDQFRKLIALVVILGLGMMVIQDIRKQKLNPPDYWWMAALLGLAGGFATMIGNAAGPILALYLLSMRLPKNSYIGTGAWFFFIVNLSKLPLHIAFWKTISWESLSLNALLIIPIIAGAIGGFYLVKIIPEKFYRWFIILSTLASAILLF
ncbi:MAG: sulfite exporter TauE/SafE family protein [Bacteroidales bacterium]|nr:sulfite exporter TauE/SafE family protein [Bacteroidales bacterium]MCF8404089.1 sulfite exporter TauE/SafE family protein [Bacteroidales bacterium]